MQHPSVSYPRFSRWILCGNMWLFYGIIKEPDYLKVQSYSMLSRTLEICPMLRRLFMLLETSCTCDMALKIQSFFMLREILEICFISFRLYNLIGHIFVRRQCCLSFSHALALSSKKSNYLLLTYFSKSLLVIKVDWIVTREQNTLLQNRWHTEQLVV